MRPAIAATLLAGAALATTGAAPAEEQAMLAAFDRVLTAMAYAASGLCLFAIVWAGLRPDGRGRRGARRGQGKGRRGHGGGGPRPGAFGQGRRRAAEQRPCGLPNTLEQRNLSN